MATKKKNKFAVFSDYSDGRYCSATTCATLEEAKRIATKQSSGGYSVSIYVRKFEAVPVPVDLKAVCD